MTRLFPLPPHPDENKQTNKQEKRQRKRKRKRKGKGKGKGKEKRKPVTDARLLPLSLPPLQSLVFHYASDVGKLSPASTRELHISVAEAILNKESGWRALTGTTNFGVIADPSSADPRHQLAFDLFVDRVCAYVGSYYVSLRGQVDALVFAGGIGERSDRLRRAVVENCACLGFEIDDVRNSSGGGGGGDEVVREIGSSTGRDGRAHKVLVCSTDEQFEMARGAAEDPALWAEDGDDTPDLTLLRVKSGEAH